MLLSVRSRGGRRRVHASPLSLLLVLTLVSAGAASALTPSQGVAPSKSLSAAARTEAAPTEAVEPILTARTATSNTWKLPDGSYRSEVYSAPVNYRDHSGDWRPINSSLVWSADPGYSAENAANTFTAAIPEDASSTPVRFLREEDWVEFQLEGLDGAPVLGGSMATYTDAPNASKVTYELTATGLKESIFLQRSPSGPVTYAFNFRTSAGLRPILGSSGEIRVVDADGRNTFILSQPFMFDSHPQSAVSEDVHYSLEHGNNGVWHLMVTPDLTWLQSEDRVYPVAIDPTVTLPRAAKDCWITDAPPDASQCGSNSTHIRVGVTGAGGKRRGLLKFDVSDVPAFAYIEDAKLRLHMDESLTTSVSTADYTLRVPGKDWSNQATWLSPDGLASWTGGSPGAIDYGTITLNGSSTGYKTWDATDLVQDWTDQELPNRGVVVQQAGESVASVLAFTSSAISASSEYWPTLTITYRTFESLRSPEIESAVSYGIFKCMKDAGEVGDAATIGETLGTISPTGVYTRPTRPVEPSIPCANGGGSDAINRLTSLFDAGYTDEAAASIYKREIQEGRSVAPLQHSAEEEDSLPPEDARPAKWQWVMAMDHRTNVSISQFLRYKHDQYPSFFNWNDNNCSSPLGDSPYGFRFPCERHDFGYRNLKKADRIYYGNMWYSANKAVPDTRFLVDLVRRCDRHFSGWNWLRCGNWARTYHGVVSWYPPISIFHQPRWFYDY